MVCCRGACWAKTSWWAMMPASSRSELVIVPDKWSAVIRDRRTSGGNVCRQTMLRPSGRNQTPPMPAREASHAPMHVGRSGTISAKLVGREASDWARSSKSSRWERMDGERRTRCLLLNLRPCCNVLKRPRPPGMARTMLRSSPRMRCHFLTETRWRSRSSSKMASRRSAR